jgi:hypothetical protein
MADENLKSKVNREVGRINGALCDLKEEEESLRIRRARLEVEMRQAIAMRDMFEVLGRLGDLPPNAFEEYLAKRPPAADKAVRVTVSPVAAPTSPPDDVAELRSLPRPPARPVDARRKHKPDGLPSITAMITAVLKKTPGLQPAEIADFIRKQWWPDLQTPTISTTAWRMLRSGHLTQQDGRYAISGTGHRQNGSDHTVSVASAE